MSHFAVMVILPRLPQTEMDAEIERLLAPYDESLDVPEYDRPCYCLSSLAKSHGRKMADKLVGTWEAKKESFHALPEIQALQVQRSAAVRAKEWDMFDQLDQQVDVRWSAWVADFRQQWKETERDYTENHPLHGEADSECDECHGSGFYRSEYNPSSKWDWYRIGGRFDGLLTENPQSSENGFNFDAKHETLANNSVSVQELLERHTNSGKLFTAYALVMPEGEWIGRGEMGWWGMSSGDMTPAAWEATSLVVYQKYAQMDAVLLDCHI